MFQNNITRNYTGGDALGEILIMLIISFIIGWVARMFWEKFFSNIKVKIIREKTNIIKNIDNETKIKEKVEVNEVAEVVITTPTTPVAPIKEIEIKEKVEVNEVAETVPVISVSPIKSTELKRTTLKIASNGLSNDDLKIIEGIGPKIEILLKNAQVNTWDDLSSIGIEKIKMILKQGGDRFAFHNPTTWPEQAMLARSGAWEELQEFQDFLSGGKELI